MVITYPLQKHVVVFVESGFIFGILLSKFSVRKKNLFLSTADLELKRRVICMMQSFF